MPIAHGSSSLSCWSPWSGYLVFVLVLASPEPNVAETVAPPFGAEPVVAVEPLMVVASAQQPVVGVAFESQPATLLTAETAVFPVVLASTVVVDIAVWGHYRCYCQVDYAVQWKQVSLVQRSQMLPWMVSLRWRQWLWVFVRSAQVVQLWQFSVRPF